MKKIILFTIFASFTLISTAQSSLEIGAGYFRNNLYETPEKVNQKGSGGFGSIVTNQRFEFVSGMLEVKAKSNKMIEATALAQVNLLWFFEPIGTIFSDPRCHISLLAGTGYNFSNKYFNYFDIPADIRLNLKVNNWRFQAGIQTPIMERFFYEDNTEITISVFREIRFRRK